MKDNPTFIIKNHIVEIHEDIKKYPSLVLHHTIWPSISIFLLIYSPLAPYPIITFPLFYFQNALKYTNNSALTHISIPPNEYQFNSFFLINFLFLNLIIKTSMLFYNLVKIMGFLKNDRKKKKNIIKNNFSKFK